MILTEDNKNFIWRYKNDQLITCEMTIQKSTIKIVRSCIKNDGFRNLLYFLQRHFKITGNDWKKPKSGKQTIILHIQQKDV